MNEQKFMFIVYGPHSSHEALVKALNPVWYRAFRGYTLKRNPLRCLVELVRLRHQIEKHECTVLVTESFAVGVFLALARSMRILPGSVKIISFAADPGPYYLYSKRFGFIKRMYYLCGIGRVDLFICVSRMVADLLTALLGSDEKLIRTIAPMAEERYKALGRLEPDLSSDTIVFVGRVSDYYYKGLDVLLEVYETLKRRIPVKMVAVGDMSEVPRWLMSKINALGVRAVGQRKDIAPYLRESSLCLHLGRGEACAVSTQEAMRAGIPTMVSNLTGTKEIVQKVCPEYVVPLNVAEVVRRVQGYFSLSLGEKKDLSDRFRTAMDDYDPGVIIKDFVLALRKALRESEARH